MHPTPSLKAIALAAATVAALHTPAAAHPEATEPAKAAPSDRALFEAMSSAAGRRGRPNPVPEGRQGMWIAFSNHNHSAYWDGQMTLGSMQAQAFLHKMDAMALTDHNTMRGSESFEFKNPPPGLVMVKGMEWNAWNGFGEETVGHANILGMEGLDPLPSNASIDEMLTLATRRKGTVIANHPFCFHLSWKQLEPDHRLHAVEVWNGWWYWAKPLMHNDDALAWWEKAIKKGRKLTAMAGTDSHGHFFDDVARNVNWVFVKNPDPESILEAIREGRVTLGASPWEPSLFLEADQDGDGLFESMVGDVLERPASGTIKVRALAFGGDGQIVNFYTSKGHVLAQRISGAKAEVVFELSPAEGFDYVRAELRPLPNMTFSMSALTNPIYFGRVRVAGQPD